MSGISGPIPSHGLYEANADFDEQRRASRIRQAASAAASAAVSAAATPRSPPTSRRASEQRDFVRENARRLRELAASARRADAAKAAAARGPALRPQQKFADVPPRVFTHLPQRYLPPDDAGPAHQFLRAHEKTGAAADWAGPPPPLHGEDPGSSNPRAPPPGHPQRPPAVDFVRANALSAGRRPPSARSRRSPSPGRPVTPAEAAAAGAGAAPDSYRRGELPGYLMRRRQLWADARAAEEASRPDPEQPPGHRLLDEAERLRTLALLQDGQARLLGELNRLPITADTLRVRQRRTELEGQLAELEQAVKVFSRPKVFVRLDQ